MRLNPLLVSVTLAALLRLHITASPQQPARDASTPAIGTCVIGGVVTTDDAQARPVRRAVVTISSGDGRGSRLTVTDDRGRFVIVGLPAGRYTVNSSKPGWVTNYYGAKRPGRGPGLALALTEGQQITDLPLKLTPGAAISGRIVDQNGVPQVGVRPTLMQYRTIAGERMLSSAPLGGGVSTIGMVTDDRGEYRMYGLAPGTYFVAASLPAGAGRVTTADEVAWALERPGPGTPATPPSPGPAIAYPPTYYPGMTDAQNATPITLNSGEERRGIDLILQPVVTTKVSGQVMGPDGQPARGVQVLIIPTGMRSTTVTTRQSAVSNATGRFEFASVIPGRYALSARGSSQPPPATGAASAAEFVAVDPFGMPAGSMRTMDLWASLDLTVASQDLSNVTVNLEPGLTVSGKINFDATTLSPPNDLSRVEISLVTPRGASSVAAPTGNMQFGFAKADGTFEIAGVAPDTYILSAYAPGGSPSAPWVVRSAMIAGQNVADRAVAIKPGVPLSDILITFTDRSAELSGRLLDAAGRPAPEFFVFVFSTDRTLWTPNAPRHIRSPIRPASDGTYRVAALPPGEYHVAALTEVDDADIFDAAFLEQVAAAAFKITIAEGEKKKQDLQIGNR